jgi:Fe-S-cluster-containing hydrogenase component 2
VSLVAARLPRFDAAMCIGCSRCAQKCFTGALAMRDRTPEGLAAKVAGE